MRSLFSKMADSSKVMQAIKTHKEMLYSKCYTASQCTFRDQVTVACSKLQEEKRCCTLWIS